MKCNSVVNRYILRELIPPFAINLVFFMFVFLMRQILEMTHMIVNYQVSLAAFLLMIIYSMPYFLVYIIPMSVMMSVLLTFLRMSADNEITALKAGGISLYSMAAPVLVFAVAGFLITVFMSVYGMPWGRSAYERLSLEVVRSNFNIGLAERRFNDSLDGIVFYVRNIDMKSRQLNDVFIEDSRKAGISSTVVAPRGRLFQAKDSYRFVIRLYDGLISQVELDKRSAHTIRFDTYDIRMNLEDAVADAGSRRRDEKEMGFSELRQYLETAEKHDKRYYSIRLELHRKFSIPFACIALAVLAMPLGIQTVPARRSAGLGIGLVCFLLYYLLLSAGMVIGESGRYHPAPGLWAPNIVMGGLGVYLLYRAARDAPLGMFSGIHYLCARAARRLAGMRSPENPDNSGPQGRTGNS